MTREPLPHEAILEAQLREAVRAFEGHAPGAFAPFLQIIGETDSPVVPLPWPAHEYEARLFDMGKSIGYANRARAAVLVYIAALRDKRTALAVCYRDDKGMSRNLFQCLNEVALPTQWGELVKSDASSGPLAQFFAGYWQAVRQSSQRRTKRPSWRFR